MKHMSVSWRSYCWGGVILASAIVFFFVAGCNADHFSDNENSASFKSFEDAIPLMKQISEKLISDNRWVNKNTLQSLQSNNITIAEAYSGFSKVADSLDVPAYITIDGIVYEVKIELFNSMNSNSFLKQLEKKSAAAEYGITEDPDEFYANEADEEISVEIDKSDGSKETITLKNPENNTEIEIDDIGSEIPAGSDFLDPITQYNINVLEQIEYPVFILTLEETNGMEKATTQPAMNKVTTVRNWLCIESIRLYRKLDSSDEEFQYFWVPGGKRNPGYGNVGPDGVFLLDGESDRKSPICNANTSRKTKYLKASTNRKTYSPTLALFAISANTYDGVTFVESDYGGLKFYRPTNESNDFGTYYKKKQFNRWLPTRSDHWHYQGYGTYGPAPHDKDDNCYVGEMLGINQEAVTNAISQDKLRIPLRTNILGHLITYLNVEFVQESLPY